MGAVDLRGFPWESETEAMLARLMIEMLAAVVPLETLKATASVTEPVIASDRGANALMLPLSYVMSWGLAVIGGWNALQLAQGELGRSRASS
jgi:hypothetical protein